MRYIPLIEILNGIHETVVYHEDFKIRVFQNRGDENYPLHWHADTEVIMPVENTYRVVIDEKTYDLDAGDIIVIPSGELHRISAPSSGYRIILQFDCNILYELKGFSSVINMFHPCVTVTPSSAPGIHGELSKLIRDMASEYFSEQPLREASIYSMLLRFFTMLGRDCINRKDEISGLKNQKQLEYVNLFYKVCNYINDHCTENIKLDDIANIAGFSKFHFARLFKQVMNISCYDYLIDRRIMLAESLLTKPDMSIMQVAMKSGFSSLATFNRLFKARKQCTPTEYKAIYGLRTQFHEKKKRFRTV